jgi:hypothetical protein
MMIDLIYILFRCLIRFFCLIVLAPQIRTDQPEEVMYLTHFQLKYFS